MELDKLKYLVEHEVSMNSDPTMRQMDMFMVFFVLVIVVLLFFALASTLNTPSHKCPNCGWDGGLKYANREYDHTVYGVKGMSNIIYYRYYCPICGTYIVTTSGY
jgi:predicted RNA-binding Zn-ribbon protein involved in translation (DUF1610 family)